MSVQAIAWVLEHSDATGSTRCVLISIANHVAPDGEGWVYVEQVCREAKCSEDSYHRAVQWAFKAGELERDVNRGAALKAAPNRRPNHFRFLKVGSATCPPQGMRGSATCPPPGSATCPPHRGPQVADPEPSPREPYKEPRLSSSTRSRARAAGLRNGHRPGNDRNGDRSYELKPLGCDDCDAGSIEVEADRWAPCPSCHPAGQRVG